MADPDKTQLTCVAGEDPTNPRTKGAVATIYDQTGKSIYHLSPKQATERGLDSALSAIIPGFVPEKHGLFYFSQADGVPGRNPLYLRGGDATINVKPDGKGGISSCSIDVGNDPDSKINIPVSDKIPGRAPAPAPAPSAPAGPRRVAEGPGLDMNIG